MAALAIHFFGLDGSTPPPTTTTTATTAPPTTTPTSGSSSCHVTDTIQSWNTGLTSNMTLTNTGSSAINGWTLGFTLPGGQVITSGWNATYTPTSGAVTATNAAFNAAIAPGTSVGFGFQANQTGNAGAPTSFTLNGATCVVG
jgi:cellulase/cellobiase CelA1